MSKTPGRKPRSSPFRKTEISSDAKILATLIVKEPQTKEEICKEAKISDRTFYRNIRLLKEKQIIKDVDHMYALWNFDFIETKIENAFYELLKITWCVGHDRISNKIGVPWSEIETAAYTVAKKMGLTHGMISDRPAFYKVSH